jgi:hypothetical protein
LPHASSYPPDISTGHKAGSLTATLTATSPPAGTRPRSENTAPRHVKPSTPPALTRRAYKLWKTFKITPRTHRNSRQRSSPCVIATTPTTRSRRSPVCGYPTSDTPRAEGRQAIRTAYERFLKPRPDVASSEYDNLHSAFIDKTLECSLLKLKLKLFTTCTVCTGLHQ